MAVPSQKNQWTIYLSLFFLINIFLSSYFIDIWPTPNCVSRALPVLAFSEDKTLKIDKYADLTIDKSKVGEHFYSDKAPLPTLCMIPLYELIKLCGFDKVSDNAGRKYPVYIGYHIGINDSRDYTIPATDSCSYSRRSYFRLASFCPDSCDVILPHCIK